MDLQMISAEFQQNGFVSIPAFVRAVGFVFFVAPAVEDFAAREAYQSTVAEMMMRMGKI